MNNLKKISILLILVSISACAPVVYDSAYNDYYPHREQGDRYVTYVNHEPVLHQFQPVEVKLFPGRTYSGTPFEPIRLVIADNEYIRIPVKNRRGYINDVFAHYRSGELHFDSDRYCTKIKGSSHFNHEKQWDKGRKYKHIKLGRERDLGGLILNVRNVSKRYHKEFLNQSIEFYTQQHHENAERHRASTVNRNHRYDNEYSNRIKVSIAGGTVYVDGKKGKYKKTDFTIKDGEKLKVALVSKDDRRIVLPITYRNGTLNVKRVGSFKSDSSWHKGRTFKLSTEGETRLKNVKLTVIAL